MAGFQEREIIPRLITNVGVSRKGDNFCLITNGAVSGKNGDKSSSITNGGVSSSNITLH